MKAQDYGVPCRSEGVVSGIVLSQKADEFVVFSSPNLEVIGIEVLDFFTQSGKRIARTCCEQPLYVVHTRMATG